MKVERYNGDDGGDGALLSKIIEDNSIQGHDVPP